MSEDFWPRPSITFVQYLNKVSEYLQEYSDQRIGQAHFNILYQTRPDLADAVCGTARDPYYWGDGDKRLHVFLAWLGKEWDK